MWKNINGKLKHLKDDSRVKFRSNISQSILNKLNELAARHNTYANYLLETGLQNVLAEGVITFSKESRPKDRVQYKTTYDKELLEKVKQFAKDHELFINDVIEYSFNYIDVELAKKQNYRSRIEKG